MNRQTRRSLFTRMVSGLGLAALMPQALRAAALTPRAAEGPYYPQPDMRRADTDNDLVKIAGAVREAGGEVVHLSGLVRDADGTPLTGLRVEIWQCDTDGNYLHPRDRRSAGHDPAFQGFGHDITDADGRYSFRTIRPMPYPGRTPHIHVKVLDSEGWELLTTQFYLKEHPDNAGDGLYSRMSTAQAAAVTMDFRPGPDGPEAQVDIVVDLA